MPNIYTKCSICRDYSNIESSYQYSDNYQIWKNDYLIHKILLKKLPNEIALMIINKCNSCVKCEFCNNILCPRHLNISEQLGMFYKGKECIMCRNCSIDYDILRHIG